MAWCVIFWFVGFLLSLLPSLTYLCGAGEKQLETKQTKGIPKFLSKQLPPSKEAQVHVELRKGLQGARWSALSLRPCPSSLWLGAFVKILK